MTLRFDSPDEYLAAAAPLIVHDLARSASLRTWIDGLKRADPAERAFMAIWPSGERPGVAYQRADYPLVVGDSTPQACAAFADALAGEHPALEGVVGKREACEAFAAQWRMHTGFAHRLRFHMRNHVLRDLIPPPAVSGSMRVATQADRDWLLEMHEAFAAEARIPGTRESALRQIDERLESGALRIWTDVESVAFVGMTIASKVAARVGPVYTCPSFRGRGYGAGLVGAICAELTGSGRRVFLVTDVANATSNALYVRLGFEPLDDSCWFDLVAQG